MANETVTSTSGIIEVDDALARELLDEVRRYEAMDGIGRTDRPEGGLTMRELSEQTGIADKRLRRIVSKMILEKRATKVRGTLNGRTAVFYLVNKEDS